MLNFRDLFMAQRIFTFSEVLECIELTTEPEHLKDRDLGASQRFHRLLWPRFVSLEQLTDPRSNFANPGRSDPLLAHRVLEHSDRRRYLNGHDRRSSASEKFALRYLDRHGIPLRFVPGVRAILSNPRGTYTKTRLRLP